MAVHVSFDGNTYKNINGYRISACFQTGLGFNGAFFVYVKEVISSQNDFSAIQLHNPPASSGKKRGTLEINDDDSYIAYSFNDIDLVACETHVTHERKERLFTFQYDSQVTNEGNFCTIENGRATPEAASYNSKVAQDYKINISNVESMLSFSSRFSRNALELIQFGTIRSKDNSFLELGIKLSDEQNNGGIKEQSISYKDVESEINRDNLRALLVIESYGDFVNYNTPALSLIARTPNLIDLTYFDFNTFTPLENLKHSRTPGDALPGTAFQESVETATLILNNGAELEKAESII